MTKQELLQLAGELTKDLGMSDNTVRKHIKELIQEGIIPERIKR